MADQDKEGMKPIASGLQPGPGEHLRDDPQSAGTIRGTGAIGAGSGAGMSSGSGLGSTTGLGSGMGSGSSAAGSSGGVGMDGMGSGASSSTSTVKDKVREGSTRIATEARHYAGDMASKAKEKSRSVFDQQKESAVGQVSSVASAIRTTADQLQGNGQDQVARYVTMVADQLESFSGRLREKDLDTLVSDAQNLARRAPGTFFIGTVVAGMLLARFMKSSAARHDEMQGMEDYTRSNADAQSAPLAAMPVSTSSTGAAPVGADGTPGTTTGSTYGTATAPLNGASSGGTPL